MNRIIEVFGRSPVLLPVIHPVGRAEALESVRVVANAGAPGVFLIDQGMGETDVLVLVREVRERHPELWIGLNLLGRRPAEALETALDACDGRIDGIWSDDAGIDEDGGPQPRAEEFVATRRARGWTGLYFGGVAFKYQRTVPFAQLGKAAALAANYMDVVCTSGPGTGKAADIAKVRAMHDGMGDNAFALASGVTPENVRDYVPFADAFLVGTGIEVRFGVMDEVKVAELLHELAERPDRGY